MQPKGEAGRKVGRSLVGAQFFKQRGLQQSDVQHGCRQVAKTVYGRVQNDVSRLLAAIQWTIHGCFSGRLGCRVGGVRVSVE